MSDAPAIAQPAIGQPAIAQPAIAQPAIAQPAIAQPAISKPARSYEAWRIAPHDSNRLAFIFDPVADGANFIAAVEIFDEGGRTPPNTHGVGQEMFFVLQGNGRATCDGRTIDVSPGDSLLLKPGTEHALENTGPGRLYCLTIMVPDDGFSTLIRSGVRAELDAQDLAVLARVAR